jgi:hypothetical protein
LFIAILRENGIDGVKMESRIWWTDFACHRDKNPSGTLVFFKYIIALAMNYNELL